MSEKKTKNNFVAQASILAAAGIISRIIGLLYRSPLTAVIGTLGIGYYQTAYEIYTIVLLISSYSIPSAISKVIAAKLAVGEYKNAHRIFLCALGYVLVVGFLASCILFFGAGLFVTEAAVPVLRTLAPTIFLYGMLGVLRGYFQAQRSMVQTSVSQILEQIINAVVSVSAAWLLIKTMMGTLEVPTDTVLAVKRATFGAMGSAMGTGAGVLFTMLFMWVLYVRGAKQRKQRLAEDGHTNQESYADILRTITLVVLPFILGTAIYNLNSSVNMTIYTKWYPAMKNLDSVTITDNYGVFSGLARTISNIPIAFASAMASAMIPSIAHLIAAGKKEETKEKIAVAVKVTMLISIPAAVGLFVLAKPLNGLLFPSQTDETLTFAGYLLMTLALSVVFYALSTLSNSILQGLGKVNVPIYNAAIALVLQTLIAMGLLYFTDLNIYALAVVNTLYSAILCILNQIALQRAVGYRQDIIASFLRPALAALIMGVATHFAYQGFLSLTHSMRIAVLPAICVAVVVYGLALLFVGGLSREDLLAMPKGSLLVRVLDKSPIRLK